MTDLDRSSLDRILPAATGSADWDDVMRRAGRSDGHRRRVLVLAFAVLVVVVGTASAFGGVRALFLDRGFIGLPPRERRRAAPPAESSRSTTGER